MRDMPTKEVLRPTTSIKKPAASNPGVSTMPAHTPAHMRTHTHDRHHTQSAYYLHMPANPENGHSAQREMGVRL
jgi:hypothetical protein